MKQLFLSWWMLDSINFKFIGPSRHFFVFGAFWGKTLTYAPKPITSSIIKSSHKLKRIRKMNGTY
jgi:hypothetical protein